MALLLQSVNTKIVGRSISRSVVAASLLVKLLFVEHSPLQFINNNYKARSKKEVIQSVTSHVKTV
jgi:hypothetical protein